MFVFTLSMIYEENLSNCVLSNSSNMKLYNHDLNRVFINRAIKIKFSMCARPLD